MAQFLNDARLVPHLAQKIAQLWPDRGTAEVEPPALLSAGWESDIYAVGFSFEAGGAEAARADVAVEQGVVARLYFGGGTTGHVLGESVEKKAHREFALLERLHGIGYPCPRPLWVDGADSPWGRPALVMERLPGVPMWATVFRAEPEIRRRALALFVDLMLKLHRLDPSGAGIDEILDTPGPEAGVTALPGRLLQRTHALPDMGFGPGMDRLLQEAAQIRPERVGIIHWDFHPENLLIEGFGLENPLPRRMGVIDWSGAELADTRYDLAWTLVVVGSQEGREAAQRILAAYEQQAGDQPDLHFFLAFAYFRRLFVMVTVLNLGGEAIGLRPGVEELLRARLEQVAALYGQWLELTGVQLPGVERVLEAN